MRTERRMTIDEIAERLALPRTTINHWVRGISIERTPRQAAAQKRAAEGTARRAREAREAAYAMGAQQYLALRTEPTFRDFLCLYIGEGSKRNRNRVEICNSDPTILVVATRWLRKLTDRPLTFGLQYHADQDPEELRRFWAAQLDVDDPARIKLQRKSNSNQLSGRAWRSRYGVLAVGVNDTLFRARLQAWMDAIRLEWT